MPKKTNLPCYGVSGEGCPGLPSCTYQPYTDGPTYLICGVHAERVRKYYARSKRLRGRLADVLHPMELSFSAAEGEKSASEPIEPVVTPVAGDLPATEKPADDLPRRRGRPRRVLTPA